MVDQDPKLTTRRTAELEPHPLNATTYGDREDLAEPFVEDIKRAGIRNPLVVTNDNTIISGHRRWEAARQLNIDTIPVEVREFDSDLERREAVIGYNRQREKSFSQQMREGDALEEIERKRAKRRQGDRSDLRKNLPESEEYGRSRDKVAEKIDIGSGTTYLHARTVWNAAEEGDPVAQHEVEKLDRGSQTIHGAWNKVRDRHDDTVGANNRDATETERGTSASIDNTDGGSENSDPTNGLADETISSDDLILSAHVASNTDVFRKVLELHLQPGDTIADVTYGEGTFWKRVPADKYELLLTDLDPEKSPNSDQGIDYRDLPYADGELDGVILDPPYAEGFYDEERSASESEYWIKERYANARDGNHTYHEAVLHEYEVAGREARRVLSEGGRLIVKLQDEVSRNEQRLTHIEVTNIYEEQIGFNARDLFVVVRQDTPTVSNIKRQRRARKNHSYFMVFVC